MRRRFGMLIWCFAPLVLCAQPGPAPQSNAPAQASPPAVQQPAAAAASSGLQPDWDVRAVLQEISDHAGRLQPVLNKVNVKDWAAKGASETYAQQLQSSRDQARAIITNAHNLASNPEKLSACLELYFRVQGLDEMINSLVGGVRKYQDGTLADELASVSAENGANRNRLQTYIVSLAQQREQECAVMDREAQRCRSIVATEPPPASKRGGKK